MTAPVASPLAPSTSADLGARVALASLSAMGPRRLHALIARWGALEAWDRVRCGPLEELVVELGPATGAQRRDSVERLVASWRADAVGVDPEGALARHREQGVRVLVPDDADFPEALRADIEPPAVLFTRGDTADFASPRVAIVGTRRCTGTGAGVARELGRELSAAGVRVVSGLALGIDGAAHRGVFDALPDHPAAAPPIGVVGSGIDVVYPARHRELWHRVGEEGTLLSEAPLGCRPTAWRFPARNRMIAALADVVVVVESHERGGSLHTVSEASRRGVDVMAVPGSVRSAASAGVNQLLAEGCHPVRDAGDVLIALGLGVHSRRRPVDHRPTPSADGRAVLDALEWEPATIEQLAVRSGLGIPELAVALQGLLATGWVQESGGWLEQVAP